jgi:hypothetical protein
MKNKEYRLTDKQLAELVMLVPVTEIKKLFPLYAPGTRTIYRRLGDYGIKGPAEIRRAFVRDLKLSAPISLSDDEAKVLVDQSIAEQLEELSKQIEEDAQAYRERVNP